MLRRPLLFTALSALLLVSLPGAPCAAQDDRARLHFQAGASYYEAGDYDDALREFQRSHALSERSELFYNFSLCYQQLGDLENAALYLRRFLDDVSAIDNRDQLERRHANLLERIEQQRVEAEERAAREANGEVGVDTQGDATGTGEQGSSTDLDTVGAASDAPVERPTERSEGGVHPGVIAGYAAAGVGVVLAATFGPLALRERNSVEAGCGADRSCTSGEVQQMDGFALAADIGLVMAVAGATVGTIFLLRGRGRGGESEDPQAALRIAPYAGPSGAGAVLRGAF